MAKSISFAANQMATVPVFSVDAAGNEIGPVPPGTSVSSDNPQVTAAVQADPSGATSVLVAATVDQALSANLTLSAAGLTSDSLAVSVSAVAPPPPVAVGVVFDTTGLVLAPNPNAPVPPASAEAPAARSVAGKTV